VLRHSDMRVQIRAIINKGYGFLSPKTDKKLDNLENESVSSVLYLN